MNAFANHFAFEFKTGLRNPSLLLMNYLFPLGLYAMLGAIFTQINPLFKDTIIPAMAIITALTGTVLGLPGPLVEAREAGIFRSFKINGVPALSILSIPALAGIVHVLIVTAVITLTAPLLFQAPLPANGPAFALVTALMAFACAGFGSLIGVVSQNSRATILWSQLIFLPSMILGGLMMPLESLPVSMRPIAGLLPSAHAMQAYMGLAYGAQTVIDPSVAVGVLLTGGVLAFGLAMYLFDWDSRNQARRGHPLLGLLVLVPYLAAIALQ